MRLQGKTVLIFVAPQFEDLELLYPKIRLEEEGATVVVAGMGEKSYAGKKGHTVTADTNVDDVYAEEYDALVIPGGWAPDVMRRSDKLLGITKDFAAAGKPVAFICHAAWVLASAGLLKGRRATCVRAIRDDVVNAGAEYVDEAVVVDRNLISSRTPADLAPFCRALIAAIAGEQPA
jgi:protease I